MAERINADIVEVEASHVPFITRPREIADVIDQAARSVLQSAIIPAAEIPLLLSRRSSGSRARSASIENH